MTERERLKEQLHQLEAELKDAEDSYWDLFEFAEDEGDPELDDLEDYMDDLEGDIDEVYMRLEDLDEIDS